MSDWLGMIPAPRTPRPDLRARVLERALRARPRRRWSLAAAAVLALALAGSAGWWARGTIESLRAERDRLAAELAAARDTLGFVHGPATRAIMGPVSTAGTVTIFADTATGGGGRGGLGGRGGRWLVRCEGMVPNRPDQTYQIWFITEGGGPHPAALMTMNPDEPGVMTMAFGVPAEAGRVVGAAMTIEPRDGSAEPRGPVVFRVRL